MFKIKNFIITEMSLVILTVVLSFVKKMQVFKHCSFALQYCGEHPLILGAMWILLMLIVLYFFVFILYHIFAFLKKVKQ